MPQPFWTAKHCNLFRWPRNHRFCVRIIHILPTLSFSRRYYWFKPLSSERQQKARSGKEQYFLCALEGSSKA